MHRVLDPSFHCSRSAALWLHPVQTQIARQHLLQGAADLPGGELPLSPARQLEDPQGAQDPRMHREFVHVHLGEHGIQMHERPGAGDFKSQHRVDLGALVGEDGRCQLPDGLLYFTAAQVQDVPALDPEILVRRIVQRHLPGVVRMMPQHIVAVQGLPVAGVREHMVQAHASADAGEGVPGEIQVGGRRAPVCTRLDSRPCSLGNTS